MLRSSLNSVELSSVLQVLVLLTFYSFIFEKFQGPIKVKKFFGAFSVTKPKVIKNLVAKNIVQNIKRCIVKYFS